MKNHPTTRSYRRQLEREHREEYDYYTEKSKEKDRYEPRGINKPYCPDCHKEKLQFESKESAERYLLFNGDKILEEKGKKPIRAYYCTSCCCWHVTSKEYRKIRIA